MEKRGLARAKLSFVTGLLSLFSILTVGTVQDSMGIGVRGKRQYERR